MNKPKTLNDLSTRQILAVWESLRDETFSFEHNGQTYLWNVSRAKAIIAERPRDPDHFRPAEQGVTREHLEERYPTLDWEYARTTDLAQPLLFVPFAGRAQCIDGWHRLGRAVLEGISELPAYLLTEEEANECLVFRLPPGENQKGGRP